MRFLVRFVVFLLVLAIVGVGALMLIPGDRIAKIAERQFEEATGRAVTIGGDVRATIYPQLGVQLEGIEVANADWSDSGPMVTAESVSVGVAMMPLLTGEVRIKRVEVVGPVVQLEVAENGRTNWDFDTGTAPATEVGADEASGSIPEFSLDNGMVRGGSVRYRNRATGYDVALSDMDLDLSLPEFAGPAELSLSAIINGTVQTIKADVARFDTFLSGAVTGLSADLGVGGSKVEIAGRGGYAPTVFEGNVTADLSDMSALFATLGQTAPDLPEGLGRQASMSGQLTYTAEGVAYLREGKLTLDQNTLTGEADVDMSGERPRVNAQFTADKLDFSSLAAGDDGDSGGNAGAAGDGWSTDRIDASALSSFDGQIAFRANAIDLGTLKLGPTRALATNDRSRIVFDLREVNAYEGVVTGQFVMNNRSGLSVGGNLRASEMAMQPLLTDLSGYERLIGTADMELEFLGVGNSVDAIMKSLSGKGAFLLGAGELRGLDLVGMLRNLDASYEGEGSKTIFESIGATFDMAGGVLSNDDLSFRSPLVTATGAGTVGIGERTLNYRVVPVALQGDDGSGGFSVPVLITGTWADPKFRPDLQSLIDRELADEREALEERLRQEAQERLGVEVQEGEDVEDALKRRLEEEAAEGLRRLLGGD
ncbi:AsmA family protein [Aliiroseovarius sp. YM-037]|uniref:AsmA family protein n=1 Tax=Aliiroseovarius sp. YM-037 TaxID=3341728 RepID=UPI003A80D4D7